MKRGNRQRGRMIKLTAVLGVMMSTATSAKAVSAEGWLNERDMQKAFSGKTVAGRYVTDVPFTETYWKDGSIDYADSFSADKGNWRATGHGFCTFYVSMNGGCFAVKKSGDNCFEFYILEDQDSGADNAGQPPRFVAQGWYPGKPPTCQTLSS
jgi:hypothetical protein